MILYNQSESYTLATEQLNHFREELTATFFNHKGRGPLFCMSWADRDPRPTVIFGQEQLFMLQTTSFNYICSLEANCSRPDPIDWTPLRN